jgi:hypothetical protein
MRTCVFIILLIYFQNDYFTSSGQFLKELLTKQKNESISLKTKGA